jgi:ATP-dependent Clp protease ATP-binding subunit ClpX
MSEKHPKPDREREAVCSFCRKSYRDVGPLVEGHDDVFICAECAELCASVIKQEQRRRQPARAPSAFLNEIQSKLTRCLPGQSEAIQRLTTAVDHHCCRRVRNENTGTADVDKRNFLLVGPDHLTQLFIARALADLFELPFARTDIDAFRSSDAQGQTWPEVLLQLLDSANFDLEAAQWGIVYVAGIDRSAKSRRDATSPEHDDYGAIADSLLKLLKRTKTDVIVRTLQFDTSNILFICGGRLDGLAEIVAGRLPISLGPSLSEWQDCLQKTSASDLISAGMPPELAECFPVVVPLAPIGEEQLGQILSRVELKTLW